jgi:hypothetical protein
MDTAASLARSDEMPLQQSLSSAARVRGIPTGRILKSTKLRAVLACVSGYVTNS